MVPQDTRAEFPAAVTVTAEAIPSIPGEQVVELPRDGQAGDLLALIDNQRRANLWFCVRSADGGPAQWAQVLLGPAFDGTR